MSGALSSGDAPTVSEREAVRREWQASAKTRCAALHRAHIEFDAVVPCAECVEQAALRYPLPKIERLRVVADPSGTRYGPASGCVGALHWSVIRGFLEPVNEQGFLVKEWRERSDWYPTPERVAAWADLLGNPTEMVDDVPSSSPSGSGT